MIRIGRVTSRLLDLVDLKLNRALEKSIAQHEADLQSLQSGANIPLQEILDALYMKHEGQSYIEGGFRYDGRGFTWEMPILYGVNANRYAVAEDEHKVLLSLWLMKNGVNPNNQEGVVKYVRANMERYHATMPTHMRCIDSNGDGLLDSIVRVKRETDGSERRLSVYAPLDIDDFRQACRERARAYRDLFLGEKAANPKIEMRKPLDCVAEIVLDEYMRRDTAQQEFADLLRYIAITKK